MLTKFLNLINYLAIGCTKKILCYNVKEIKNCSVSV